MNELRDEDLLDRWRAGDTVAGAALFERYFPLVERFFATKVAEGAEDLIQATFMGCLHGRDRITVGAHFRAYLLGIARHELMSYYTRQRRSRARVDPNEALSAMRDGGASPSALLAHREEQRALLNALRMLPLDQQIVLELHYWEDLSTAEIAEVVDIPAGTVKSRLRLARETLKEQLREATTRPQVAEATITNLDSWARSLRTLISPCSTHEPR